MLRSFHRFGLGLATLLVLAVSAAPARAALIVGALSQTNKIYTISDTGVVTNNTLTGTTFTQQLAPVVVGGNVYVTNASSLYKITSGSVVSSFASGFSNAYGITADSLGNLYVANQSSTTVSKVTPGGVVSTYGTGMTGAQGVAFDSIGNLYVTTSSGGLYKVAPGGGAGSLVVNTAQNQQACAFDSAGNLYFPNGGTSIAKVTFTSPGVYGSINTTWGTISNGRGLAIDGSDNIFAVSQSGFVQKYTTAGGPGTSFATGLTGNAWFVTVGALPEPASFGSLAVAGVGLIRRRRR